MQRCPVAVSWEMTMIHKMYCIFARESLDKINGVRGKLATQAGHAYLHAFWDSEQRFRSYYGGLGGDNPGPSDLYKASERAYKITLVVDTVDELKAIQAKYKDICGTSLVTDAGFTVFKEPTTTCLGLGPISEYHIGDDLESLKTLT